MLWCRLSGAKKQYQRLSGVKSFTGYVSQMCLLTLKVYFRWLFPFWASRCWPFEGWSREGGESVGLVDSRRWERKAPVAKQEGRERRKRVMEQAVSVRRTGQPVDDRLAFNMRWSEGDICPTGMGRARVSLHAHQPFEPDWKWHVCECNKYLCISWSGSLSQRAKVLEITLTAVGRYPGLSQFKCDCLNGNCCFRC